jgi:hypothetical protein
MRDELVLQLAIARMQEAHIPDVIDALSKVRDAIKPGDYICIELITLRCSGHITAKQQLEATAAVQVSIEGRFTLTEYCIEKNIPIQSRKDWLDKLIRELSWAQ